MNITKTYNRFKPSEGIFRCPVCTSEMTFRNENSLVCLKNHCFDLSKNGYVNFAPNQSQAKYTKELFESRRYIFQSGFYNPLQENVNYFIDKYLDASPHVNILDAGCGEGFFTSNLFTDYEQSTEVFAMDIVKEAILLAAKGNGNIKWMVGDLSNIPLRSNSMNMLLNIFSPANYNEFTRVLNDNGFLIKVVPGKQYLKELRECAKDQLIRKEYSNEQVLQCFHKNMVCLDHKNLFYQLPLSTEHLENFIKMTPMMFHIDTKKIALNNMKQITIDVGIFIGKKA